MVYLEDVVQSVLLFAYSAVLALGQVMQLVYWWDRLPSLWSFVPPPRVRAALHRAGDVLWRCCCVCRCRLCCPTTTSATGPDTGDGNGVVVIGHANGVVGVPTGVPGTVAADAIATTNPKVKTRTTRTIAIARAKAYFLWLGLCLNVTAMVYAVDMSSRLHLYPYAFTTLLTAVSLGGHTTLYGVWLQHTIRAQYRRLNRLHDAPALAYIPGIGALCWVWCVCGTVASLAVDRWFLYILAFSVTYVVLGVQIGVSLVVYRAMRQLTERLWAADEARRAAEAAAAQAAAVQSTNDGPGGSHNTSSGAGAGAGAANQRRGSGATSPGGGVSPRPVGSGGGGGGVSPSGAQQQQLPAVPSVSSPPPPPPWHATGSTGGFALPTIVHNVRRQGWYLAGLVLLYGAFCVFWVSYVVDTVQLLEPGQSVWRVANYIGLENVDGAWTPVPLLTTLPTNAAALVILREAWTPMRADALDAPPSQLKRRAAAAAAALRHTHYQQLQQQQHQQQQQQPQPAGDAAPRPVNAFGGGAKHLSPTQQPGQRMQPYQTTDARTPHGYGHGHGRAHKQHQQVELSVLSSGTPPHAIAGADASAVGHGMVWFPPHPLPGARRAVAVAAVQPRRVVVAGGGGDPSAQPRQLQQPLPYVVPPVAAASRPSAQLLLPHQLLRIDDSHGDVPIGAALVPPSPDVAAVAAQSLPLPSPSHQQQQLQQLQPHAPPPSPHPPPPPQLTSHLPPRAPSPGGSGLLNPVLVPPSAPSTGNPQPRRLQIPPASASPAVSAHTLVLVGIGRAPSPSPGPLGTAALPDTPARLQLNEATANNNNGTGGDAGRASPHPPLPVALANQLSRYL